ncbi:MAG: tRNA (adenosine(37)-N6)-dimethylallyltransferase MiaA [Candidatus Vogelbacteria bacterium CG22_combo_CG10-13_8_21_14_all_37_9]|uniref:tRNA dimethylallyltransferase n=1 Tax=Candidatus Vogelbacteria bacterium CG22_combo_CG10-13_8_21_14_all_37_9 TaxID=1975046 RepID=A0A2H0BLB5_9BACT|nr:MAG: tRNA (adenosine(37)-N6)-dimethylallyltransferase MiaA [Candidatus Vogelbacteria bacterium CG22_combo_CG10-13_8_21_14_all_37_9]
MINIKSAQGRSASGGKPKIIVLLGPTASGKSDLAVKLAKQLKNLNHVKGVVNQNSKEFLGEIISADSRQVYRGLNLGTGKITKREMTGVPHHLLDVADPKRIFTVTQYQKLAKRAIKDIAKRGHLPIICGGTGFYLETLVFDKTLPVVKPNLKLRRQLEKKTPIELWQNLKQLDPNRAETIDPNNKVRLIRAIEITTKLGKVPPLSKLDSPYDCLWLGLKLSDQKLAQNIHQRLVKRLKQGLVAEVRNLQRSGLSWTRLEALGLEYRYVALFLQHKLSKKEMFEQLEKVINHYAKRQMTWFRHLPNINWIETETEALKTMKEKSIN